MWYLHSSTGFLFGFDLPYIVVIFQIEPEEILIFRVAFLCFNGCKYFVNASCKFKNNITHGQLGV